MAHIAGIELPKDKRVIIGLTYIYGIGLTTSTKLLARTGIDPDKRVKDLTLEEEKLLRDIITTEHVVEGEMRTQVAMDIKRLMEIGAYRGLRHKRSMPVRGQRTHTNARTRRGRRRGSAVGKKKS
ncbi:MAG: 30S ribosomal protein S13 [Candidatus Cloacimonetes bacterium]|nr:30S ribosomal protein S13 [Candidatus Cloacimonadota bacterium]